LVFYRLSVVTCATLARSTGFLPGRSPHPTIAEWFVYQDLPTTSSPNSRFRAMLGSSSGGAVIIIRRLLPGSPGRPRSTDTHKTRFDLRHAPDCDLVAVNDRTLSQSARPAHPCGLLAAYSITGTLDSLQSLFPVRLQLAASLRRQLRQPGCDSKLPKLRLRATETLSSTVLISSACRIFQECASVSLCTFPHEARLSPVFMLPG
jgi:hypothetical protein